MILNRIASGLRKNDWGTIAIEILIVVVGIFLGLQVDDWNESRKERQRETRYLERLYEDLEQDIDTIEANLSSYSAREDMADFLLETVRNPELIMSEPSRFVISVLQAAFTSSPAISDHTFEELKFSGDLVIIQDEALRSALSKYYTGIEQHKENIFARESRKLNYGNASIGILTADHIQLLMTAGPGRMQGISFSVDDAWQAYERMIEKPAFIDQIPLSAYHGREIRTYTVWVQRARDLRETIGRVLQRG